MHGEWNGCLFFRQKKKNSPVCHFSSVKQNRAFALAENFFDTVYTSSQNKESLQCGTQKRERVCMFGSKK